MGFEIIRPTGWVEPEMSFDCRWYVAPVSARLVCVRHDEFTAPWRHAPGCCLPVALLCAICAREAVEVRYRFGWTFLCRRCTAIDREIARPLGTGELTPHRSPCFEGATVFGRLFPARRADRQAVPTTDARGGAPEASQREADPDSALMQLLAFGKAQARHLATTVPEPHHAPGKPLWDDWMLTHPVSAHASATAFQRFVEEVHPWIASVEPRVADAAWLAELAERKERRGGS